MVYLSITIFVIATIARAFKMIIEPKHSTSLKVYPEKRPKWFFILLDVFTFTNVRKNNPILWIFLMIFHTALIFIIIGHLELIRNFNIFQFIQHEVFIGKGYVGLILFITLLFFLFRRFVSPNKELSVFEDYIIIILLILTVLFGSQMDWARRLYGYSDLTVEDYRAYLSSLLILKPHIPEGIKLSGHSFMLVLHIFFANLFLIYFPFSKIMHAFFSIPVNKLSRG